MSKKAKLPGSKKNRKEIIEFINKIIEEEHGNPEFAATLTTSGSDYVKP